MARFSAFRGYLIDLVVVFVGVALAFAVENLREDLNERAVGVQYMEGFRQDLQADANMLDRELEIRQRQLSSAATVIEFFEGRTIDPQAFFEAYYAVLLVQGVAPNRNTMDEVLNSGNLRLIQEEGVRTGLLDLYATYHRIAVLEEHMSRDFDIYLYDPTFTSIPLRVEGPWTDTPENHQAVEVLLESLTVENGIRLFVANLQIPNEGLLAELQRARSQVDALLRQMPVD